MRRVGAWGRRGVTVALSCALLGCGESRHTPPADAGGSGAPFVEDPRGEPGQLLVLDGLGLPFANFQVLVDDTVVTTDANGFAPLPSVGTTYDVSMVVAGGAETFRGMRARAPVFQFDFWSSLDEGAYVDLNIPLPALAGDQEFVYTAGASDAGPFEEVSSNPPDIGREQVATGAYWPPALPVTTFSAEAFLVDTDDSGVYLGFSSYASQTFDVTSGDELVWSPVFGASPFATKPIHVDFTLPPGATTPYYQAFVTEPSGREGYLSDLGAVAKGDLLVPDLPGAVFTVSGTASSADGTLSFAATAGGVHTGDSVTLEVHDGPVVLGPDNDAAVSADTDFSWSGRDGDVYELELETLRPDYSVFVYDIVTAEPTERIPDLSLLGVPFPEGQLYWETEALENLPAVDAYAAGTLSNAWSWTEQRHAAVAH
ncbi:MAG TPA: hypothetical protein VMI54_00250 [Polyangiaceae bacterium]|nr:hypothetical protein [Polyangiaceae bacterium]